MRTLSIPLAVALLAAGLACADSDEAGGASGAPRGEKVFAAQGCALCHGADGEGTSFGPTLRGKAPFWTREKLVLYLKAPVAYADKDPRLAEQKKRYSMPMRQFDKVPDDELAAVADYVLGLP